LTCGLSILLADEGLSSGTKDLVAIPCGNTEGFTSETELRIGVGGLDASNECLSSYRGDLSTVKGDKPRRACSLSTVSADTTSLLKGKSSDQKESNDSMFVLAIEETILSIWKYPLEPVATPEAVLIKLGLHVEPFVTVMFALLELGCKKSGFQFTCMDRAATSLNPHAVSSNNVLMLCTTCRFSAICTIQLDDTGKWRTHPKCRASEEAGKVAQDKRSDTHQIC
jgi:hypothetical protein